MRPAGPRDIANVLALLTEAARWAKVRGVERWWPDPFPATWLTPGIDRHEVFVAEIEGEPVGTLTLRREDPRMWGDQPPVAGYVHRLAVARRWAHHGIGARLLGWAASEVRTWGRSRLRLDCLATNRTLVEYYLAQGFRVVREVRGNVPGEDRPSVLLERALG